MYLIENPVLQRELLVNLRMTRAFVLLFLYQALLGVVVFFAWPDEEQLNLSGTGGEGQRLGDLFFRFDNVPGSKMTLYDGRTTHALTSKSQRCFA